MEKVLMSFSLVCQHSYIQTQFCASSLQHRVITQESHLFCLLVYSRCHLLSSQKSASTIKLNGIFSIFAGASSLSTTYSVVPQSHMGWHCYNQSSHTKSLLHPDSLGSTLKAKAQSFISRNCIYPPQTDITYFYVWLLSYIFTLYQAWKTSACKCISAIL